MLKYQDLAEQLIKKIDEKYWISGEKLPSIRQLSVNYKVSKNTVIQALHLLEAKGRTYAIVKVGHFVSQSQKIANTPRKLSTYIEPVKVEIPSLFSDIMAKSAAFDIVPGAQPINTSSHIVKLNRCLGRALRNKAQQRAMYYDAPLGDENLRFQLTERYRHRGLSLESNDFCITSGCQHSLFLALLSSTKPGDNVAVESPTFYGVVQLLEQLKLNIIEIPSSPVTGIDITELSNALEHWNISACIVTPSFATPSGASMTDENKSLLITLANNFDFTVIEDDIYGELAFEQIVSPLKAQDIENRVILCGSFSKSLSRDLRLGWIVGGTHHEDIIRLKLISQLASPKAPQQAMSDFLADGSYRRHLDYFIQRLKHQKAQLIEAINAYWPKNICYSEPKGGIAIWVEFDKNIDTTQLYLQAQKKSIIITPGELFSCTKFYKNFVRLSYNHPTVGARLEAIKTIGNLLKNNNKK